MTAYLWRVAMFCPVGLASEAAALARAIEGAVSPEEVEAADRMFGTRFSADGREPAAWVGCCGAFTSDHLARMVAVSAPVGLVWARWSADTGVLEESLGMAGLVLGQSMDWFACLAAMGVRRVEPD